MTTLYNRDNTGNIREWSIERDGFDIVIKHGTMGGAMQEKREEVLEGRASRSVDEQIMLMMASRISRQRDKGYVNSLDKVGSKAVNTLGLPKPMLAQPLKKVRNIRYDDAFLQYKYDGNRCMIKKAGHVAIAYSRNGKVIDTIDHIISELAEHMNDGEIFDGELYCHGHPLQTIVSWVKRKQENTLKIKYHIYDVVSDKPYKDRFARLESVCKGLSFEVVPTVRVEGDEAVQSFFRAARANKYEGAILRWGGAGYEDGKRSKSLIKIKEWEDDEFKVIDILPSKDGWARLVCVTKDNITFNVTAPGSIEEKYYVYEFRNDFIGKTVRVEYAFMTNDGVPFHPVATMWRNKHEE